MTMKTARISSIDPATMTAGEINKELDRLDTRNSTLTDQMIADGRGYERPSDYFRKTDPLSLAMREISNRRTAIRIEIEGRYGPDAPRRLPSKGAGPRVKKPRRAGTGAVVREVMVPVPASPTARATEPTHKTRSQLDLEIEELLESDEGSR